MFAHTLCQLLLDFLKPGLAVGGLGGVHLVAGHDELLDTKGVGQQSVLPGLTVLGDAGLELSGSGGDDKHAAVSLQMQTGFSKYVRDKTKKFKA